MSHLVSSSTGFALVAILLWGSLAAVAGGALVRMPAGTLLTVSFGFAAATLVLIEALSGGRVLAALGPPLGAAMLGLYGIFGYHAFLFISFERAAAAGGSVLVEANLLNYLWPLLIVLFAAPILGERLGRRALAGALLGLAGAALTIWQGRRLGMAARNAPIHAFAMVAAAMWASYSCLLRRTAGRSAVPFAFAAGSALGLLFALARGDRLTISAPELASAAYLGVFPLGLAYACWERAVRTEGDVQRLGALAYLTPLLSTLFLRLFLGKALTAFSIAGAVLIVAGAAFGSGVRLPGRRAAK